MSSPPPAKLEGGAAEFVRAGEGAWPSLALTAKAFEAHLVALSEDSGPPLLQHAADLYLACACALGVEGAVASFEELFAPTLARAVARVNPMPAFSDEAMQALRVKLFVRRPPKIAGYGGRAKLGTWLTTIAAREAIDLRATRERPAERSGAADRIEAAVNPELEYLRARYKSEVEGAVANALSRLGSKERGLLRLHLGERLSIDRIAVMYGVGRSTAARWVASAREKLVEEARRAVQAQLGATASEVQDLGDVLRSALEVSLVRLLASTRGRAG